VPEWYFLPFYAILRAIPDKLGGVTAMFASILILFALPWLDKAKTRSGYYRPFFKWFYIIFILNFALLGYLGAQSADGIFVIASRISTIYYFSYFLFILPMLNKYEQPLPLPASIDEHFKSKHS
ncbi:MAG: cytochrome b, partial [Alphaproteobacteria bacterium]|nr:cytochrome b [Alphaproteobacteria bacterium]